MNEKNAISRTEKGVKKKEFSGEKENNSVDDLIKQGINFFEKGQFIEAIGVLATAFGMSKSELAKQYLGRCYYGLQKYELAYECFEYLAEYSTGEVQDYGKSMVAAVEIVWGNSGKAIKILKDLPPEPRNLISLAIAYWKEFKIKKGEHSIREAMRILDKIDLTNISSYWAKRIFHLKALIYQSQKEYSQAESFYYKALHHSVAGIEKGAVLNDYASLLIELNRKDEASSILEQAQLLIRHKSEIEEAFNNKWLGILAIEKKEYESARIYLEKAGAVLREKDLLSELAGIEYLLASIAKKRDFYKAAEYFANGRIFEKQYEEVKDRDEKVLNFYFDSFYGRHSDDSGSG